VKVEAGTAATVAVGDGAGTVVGGEGLGGVVDAGTLPAPVGGTADVVGAAVRSVPEPEHAPARATTRTDDASHDHPPGEVRPPATSAYGSGVAGFVSRHLRAGGVMATVLVGLSLVACGSAGQSRVTSGPAASTTRAPAPSTSTPATPPPSSAATTTGAPAPVTAPEAATTAPADPTPATGPGPVPAPAALDGVGGAGQAVVVTAGTYGTTTATLSTWQRTAEGWEQVHGPWEAYVGYAGIAPPGAKREGDGRTPSGTFGFEFLFGVEPDPGVAMPYRLVTGPSIVWDDVPSSPSYNLWVDGGTGEAMYQTPVYDYAAVVAYNTARTPGLGSAIFLHVSRGDPTAGCVSLPV